MNEREQEIARNLSTVKARLEETCKRCGCAADLVAVSKTFPAEAVLAAADAGQTVFGENYAQEGCGKVDWFKEHRPDVKLVWHFIGPLQANKTRPVAERFDWVDSVDRLRIAKRLSDQRPESSSKSTSAAKKAKAASNPRNSLSLHAKSPSCRA